MTDYKIVQRVDDRWVVTRTRDIHSWIRASGLEVIKLNDNPRQRPELQGQPVIATMCGPMWDSGVIRYEDQAANDALST